MILATVLASAACQSTPAAFGPNREIAGEHADALFDGLAQRFTNIERSPTYAAALRKIERSALVPSHIYSDASMWTGGTGSTRTLGVVGHFSGGHYTVAEFPDPPAPSVLAASTEWFSLTRNSGNVFAWNTSTRQALGSVTAQDLDRVVGSMLADAASSSSEALRMASQVTFRHTSGVLSQLFSLDTLHIVPDGDNAATITLTTRLHPDRLRPRYPALAGYFAKYLSPAHMQVALVDASDTPWLDVQFDGDRLSLRCRATRGGQFAPLSGTPRPMPDSLLLQADLRTKVWLFTIGVSHLKGDFIPVIDPHTRGWRFRFRHEPDWHLPLVVGGFVRSSLRRPFEGEGTEYFVFVRDSAGAQTLLQRDLRLTVQESTVMRWLGGIGAGAVGDLEGRAEEEENAFLREIALALREDERSVVGGALAGQ